MGICSICERDRKLTREHIWSNSVLRIFDTVATTTIDNKRRKAYFADPVIKDVCEECNNNLSVCDEYMAGLSRDFFKDPTPPQRLTFERNLILRWVLKTASNHSRTVEEKNKWWKKHINFIQIGIEIPDIDLFFAPWSDTRSHDLATMIPVHPLEARNISLHAIKNPPWNLISQYFVSGWALKVGYAVFALLDWSEDTPKELRDDLGETLNYYGWQAIGSEVSTFKTPFNEITCFFYNIITDPNDMSSLSKLIEGNR